MVQKRHQEETSVPQDTLNNAPFAAELPRPKRTKRKLRKAIENEAQENDAVVPYVFRDSSTSSGLRNLSPPQKPSKRHQKKKIPKPIGNSKKEKIPKWYIDYQHVLKKPDKLKILLDRIDPQQPFSQKLEIPGTSKADGIPFSWTSFTFNPLELFHLFIPRGTFTTIAENINKNAYLQMARETFHTQKEQQQTGNNIMAEDIGDYIEATLLLEAQPDDRGIVYYGDNIEKHPEFPVARYISRNRYEQIIRYLKINSPDKDLTTENGGRKIDALATTFRKVTTMEIYQPGQNLAIDEQLIQFTGRSRDTIQIDSKTADEEYKIYSLCDLHDFIFDFKFSSANMKIAEFKSYLGCDLGRAEPGFEVAQPGPDGFGLK